jgi:uncharacterized repeat protein (TIGR03837 family)
MRWDVYCRIVDNFGDVGVGWRLAADLGRRGLDVRFCLDDQAALAWLAPRGAPGVRVVCWDEAAAADLPEVVIETFGCGLPERLLERMAAAPQPPSWIDVEYLSAEAFVERSHRLPSPRLQGPGAGLTTWYYYPGFAEGAGGLLREPGLLERRAAFDRDAWWNEAAPMLGGVRPRAGERVVTLFAYAGAPFDALTEALADAPTLLLVTAGVARDALDGSVDANGVRGALRTVRLPFVDQAEFDRVLWASDLNVVRGEDSLVRAIWAGMPFVWHLYPQADGAHAAKLEAFLVRFLDDAPSSLAEQVGRVFRAWNGLASWPADLPEADAWGALVRSFRARLAAQQDLTSGLLAFVAKRR